MDEIAIIPSKTLRNRIAGYITRRRVVEREDVKPVDIEEESLTE